MTDITTHITALVEPVMEAEVGMLYFSAPWCGPCKVFGPVVEKFSADHPEITLSKIDVDSNREIATLYGVRGIPTIIAFRNGNETGRRVGSLGVDVLNGLINA